MNFIKKMCVLRQVKQGFSGDGKTLSGLIKIEQYGKNIAAEVSVINFAPLKSGEYYCLLADSKERTELLPLRGKSIFNVISELDFSNGFCGIICFVKNGVTPIAYGVNGNRVYDWRTLVKNTVAPAAFDDGAALTLSNVSPESANTGTANEPAETVNADTGGTNEPAEAVNADTGAANRVSETKIGKYNDETVVTENYYQKEAIGDERVEHEEACGDAHAAGGNSEQGEKTGQDAEKNVDAENVCNPFETNPDGYYLAVKGEIDELFAKYPADDALKEIFAYSEWVRVKEEGKAEYLVGVIYEDLRAKYICYALPTTDRENPPEEIAGVCTFVPASLFEETKGFFVIFQSCSTGECIRPESV